MASAASLSYASTKETTNYARLCRLLVDVGSQALRNKFDSIHPPAGLHRVLTKPPAHPILQTLRKKRILNPTQWGKLYPPSPSSVSSKDFDITLLMLLLRNICGLTPPTTGWDNLLPAADTSAEANIARVKYYRNHVYGHASQASVDDATFNTYWQDVSNALVGLGADAAAINTLKTESMDPVIEKHYQELLREWKKDDDSIKDTLEEIQVMLKKICESNNDRSQAKLQDQIKHMTDEILKNISDRFESCTDPEDRNQEKVAFDPAEFIDGIRQLYKIREGWLAPFPWCEEFRLNLDNIFTKLKIVRRKKERGTKTDETVAMNEIFRPHEECAHPRTVLIEGKPGIGKTTFCDKLAYDWATKKQGEEETLCLNFKDVLLLKCRDIKSNLWESIEEECPPRSAKQKKEEFFKSVLWDAVDDQLLPRGITEEDKEEFFKFVHRNQPDILMVLDGLDELPTSLLPAFKEIIQGRMLPKCHILVTARHEVGMQVRECCDSLLEMEGLTQADAREFIVKFFKPEGAELAQSLLNKLERDQNLRQLTESPLNTALLCLLCEESEGIFPQNGSQLYLEIVECVLRRYRKKKGLPDSCEDLTDVYKTPLKQLGLIALNGLLNSKFYFEKSDFENCADELPEFGFLSFERGRSKRRPSLGYSFLHKTFQELFAAFYICCQVLGKEICPETLIADDRYFKELKQVLLFTCGLLSLQSKEVIDTFVASIAVQVNNAEELLFALECIGECKNGESCPIDVLLAQTIGSHLRTAEMNLSFLRVGDGDCTTLAEAIKHNSTITQLDLSCNLLGCSDCNVLLEAIKHNSTITQLNLSGNGLYESDCTALAEAIKHNSTITDLDLSSNGLDTSNFSPLAEAIKQNSTITRLNWSENDLSAGDCTGLAEGVKQNSSITELDLSQNGLGSSDCTLLAAAIKHNSTITQLNLSFNELGTGKCTALAEAIKHNSTITMLDLSMNELGTGDCTALAEAIKHNSTITQLDLSTNNLGASQCSVLAEAIRHNSTITLLDLSGNDLAAAICTALAEAIKYNSTITQLDLSSNKLGTGECTAMAEAIKTNSAIKQLHLSHNKLGTGDCTALAEAIKRNSAISLLDLSGNCIGGGECTELVEAVKHNSTITYLNLSGNFISDSDSTTMIEVFKHSPFMPQVCLVSSVSGAGDCTALADAIRHNSTITELDLSDNNLGADVCSALSDAVKHNTSKTHVDLSGDSMLEVTLVRKDL